MADPRDVEAARECRGDLAKWLGLDSWNYARVFENVEREVIVPLLAAAREQERQACEQIVRKEVGCYSCTCDEAYRSRCLTDPGCSFCNVVEDIRDEILRRIRERSQPEVKP